MLCGTRGAGLYHHLFFTLCLVAATVIGCGADAPLEGDLGADAGADSMISGDISADMPTDDAYITQAVQSFPLPASNAAAYGLAYNPYPRPHRLYVADHQTHTIFTYDVGAATLTPDDKARLSTNTLHKDFTYPRGLAFARVQGQDLLFCVTSNDGKKDGSHDPLLWQIDLNSKQVQQVDLGSAPLGLQGVEVFGLAVHAGVLHVSYDTSRLSSQIDQVRKGILKLKLDRTFGQPDNLPAAGAVLGHIPHSGRSVNEIIYKRAPAFGLAAGLVEDHPYLFGTSYHKYLYAAEPVAGRGLFLWWSPGKRNIYGLAYWGGYLWAVDRVSGANQVHKVKVAGAWNQAVASKRYVRHLKTSMVSTAKAAISAAQVSHNHALIHANKYRPNQDLDPGSVKYTTSPTSTPVSKHYDPDGDDKARQFYSAIPYSGAFKAAETISTLMEADFWTTTRRHYVYPHRVTTGGAPASGYLSDDKAVYDMSDTATYDKFIAAVKAGVSSEYGATAAAAADKNPYWRARDILEYMMEHYIYGNVSDYSKGHYAYQPSNLKLKLPLDSVSGNEKMSCSTSAFALNGLMRYHKTPARWVGTSIRRGGWDKDRDGYMTAGEQAVDTAYHRWSEVWLGAGYGWQRFDPTPHSTMDEKSQYDLMRRSAIGVAYYDVVLTVGSGSHQPFIWQSRGAQGYNLAPSYANPASWTEKREIIWSNPCALQITGPATVSGSSVTVTWTASGRWDLDPGATLSIYVRESKTGASPVQLASGLSYKAGSHTLQLTGLTSGASYWFEIQKDGDAETGARGKVFVYKP